MAEELLSCERPTDPDPFSTKTGIRVPRSGIISVLHSWGSALTHHPHVRMIVPGGGHNAAL